MLSLFYDFPQLRYEFPDLPWLYQNQLKETLSPWPYKPCVTKLYTKISHKVASYYIQMFKLFGFLNFKNKTAYRRSTLIFFSRKYIFLINRILFSSIILPNQKVQLQQQITKQQYPLHQSYYPIYCLKF